MGGMLTPLSIFHRSLQIREQNGRRTLSMDEGLTQSVPQKVQDTVDMGRPSLRCSARLRHGTEQYRLSGRPTTGPLHSGQARIVSIFAMGCDRVPEPAVMSVRLRCVARVTAWLEMAPCVGVGLASPHQLGPAHGRVVCIGRR